MYFSKIPAAALSAWLLTAGHAFGLSIVQDGPSYRDGILTIPDVSTDAQVGKYQNATFEPTAQGQWRLTSVSTLDNGHPQHYRVPVERIEVIKTSGYDFPHLFAGETAGSFVECRTWYLHPTI